MSRSPLIKLAMFEPRILLKVSLVISRVLLALGITRVLVLGPGSSVGEDGGGDFMRRTAVELGRKCRSEDGARSRRRQK